MMLFFHRACWEKKMKHISGVGINHNHYNRYNHDNFYNQKCNVCTVLWSLIIDHLWSWLFFWPTSLSTRKWVRLVCCTTLYWSPATNQKFWKCLTLACTYLENNQGAPSNVTVLTAHPPWDLTNHWISPSCQQHWLAGQILRQSCQEIPILMESHLPSCQPAREVQITTLAHFLVGQDCRDQNWGLSDYAMHSLLVLTWSFSLSLSSHSQYECKACVPKPVDTLTGVPAMALPFVQVLQECHIRCTWSSRCTLFDGYADYTCQDLHAPR